MAQITDHGYADIHFLIYTEAHTQIASTMYPGNPWEGRPFTGWSLGWRYISTHCQFPFARNTTPLLHLNPNQDTQTLSKPTSKREVRFPSPPRHACLSKSALLMMSRAKCTQIPTIPYCLAFYLVLGCH